MNRRGIVVAMALLAGGCATGHWIKPGADAQAFNADSEVCTLDSWQATPEPSMYGPPCNADGSYMNCSTRASDGPARVRPLTANEVSLLAERDKARRGTYSHCLQARGWHWEERNRAAAYPQWR